MTDASEAADPDWSKATEFLSTKALAKALEEWSPAGEVVDPEYIEENLVFPLGPLANRVWDASVAHEKDIPMPKADEPRAPAGGRYGAPMADKEGMGGRGRFVSESKEGGRDGASKNSLFSPFEAPNADPRGGTPAETRSAAQAKPSPYRLFRFFDFDVQPGKQYVYRVCLAVANPNYDRKVSDLKAPELANDWYLKTKWSEPTSAVHVPLDTRLFVVSVKPARSNNEPSGQVLAAAWVHATGLELCKKFLVTRGQMANFGNENVDGTTVDFASDATIVDMRGGERLPGPRADAQFACGQMLILDPDGNLRVRDELDDAAQCQQLASEQPSEPSRARPGRADSKELDKLDDRGGKGRKYGGKYD